MLEKICRIIINVIYRKFKYFSDFLEILFGSSENIHTPFGDNITLIQFSDSRKGFEPRNPLRMPLSICIPRTDSFA